MIFHINQQNHYEMENALLYMQITSRRKESGRGKNYREVQLLRHDLKKIFGYISSVASGEGKI